MGITKYENWDGRDEREDYRTKEENGGWGEANITNNKKENKIVRI